MDMRLVLTRGVPLKVPGAMISLFSGPRGSQVGDTSALIIIDVSPLPPRPLYWAGTSSKRTDLVLMSTRNIFMLTPPLVVLALRPG